MKKLLYILLIAAMLTSGCVQTQELKFVDPNNPQNYILLQENPTQPGTGTFSIITTEYVTGGSYTSTSEAYSLQYSDYPVGVTLKKVDNGIELADNIIWHK